MLVNRQGHRDTPSVHFHDICPLSGHSKGQQPIVAAMRWFGCAPRAWRSLAMLAMLAARCVFALLPHSAHAAARVPVAHSAAAACASPYPATRDASNPLDLPVAPGANPVTGAPFP